MPNVLRQFKKEVPTNPPPPDLTRTLRTSLSHTFERPKVFLTVRTGGPHIELRRVLSDHLSHS